MTRKKSSQRWLSEHFRDPYVKQAQQKGYRSRAVYKLMELQERDKLFKPGMVIIDLGASPGGWSQYLSEILGSKGTLIGLDVLEMEPIPNVKFILGDFTEEVTLSELLKSLDGKQADWVLSDMAPNLSGIDSVDQPRSIYLAELALELALKVLGPKGGLLMKVFQGEGFEQLVAQIRQSFKKVVIRKPKASRGRSSEVYVLARRES